LFDDSRLRSQPERPVISSVTGEGEEAGHRRFVARTTNWKARLHQAAGRELSTTLEDSSGTQHTIEEAPPKATELLDTLRDHAARTASAQLQSASDADQSKEIKERLEALGYR
jgi:hypothetical protein